MYINIGSDFAVRTDTVVGVFDMDNTTWSWRTRQFLAEAEKNGQIVDTANDLPKSYVVTEEYGTPRIYLSQYRASVLIRRLEEA